MKSAGLEISAKLVFLLQSCVVKVKLIQRISQLEKSNNKQKIKAPRGGCGPEKGTKRKKHIYNMRANMHLYKMWQACEKGTFAFYLHLFFSFFCTSLRLFCRFWLQFSLFDILHAVWMLRHFCLLNFARTSNTAYHTGETSRATSQDFEWFDGICAFQLVRLSLFRYRIQPFVERLIREQLTAALYRKAEPGSKPKPKIHQDISILPGAKKVQEMLRKIFFFWIFVCCPAPKLCSRLGGLCQLPAQLPLAFSRISVRAAALVRKCGSMQKWQMIDSQHSRPSRSLSSFFWCRTGRALSSIGNVWTRPFHKSLP